MLPDNLSELLAALQRLPEEQSAQQLDQLARVMGEWEFCSQAAGYLILLARPEEAIPAGLSRYTKMVRDGIEFFLARIAYPRLRRAILSQLKIEMSSPAAERLLDLALHFPTLHKLGQIVARNRSLNPMVKRWLIRLETGESRLDADVLVQHIAAQMSAAQFGKKIGLEPDILAEASVAAVLPFTSGKIDGGERFHGVLKVLKPDVDSFLQEELTILDEAALFFEDNRERYGLRNMMIVDLFAEVRRELAREIDLVTEQHNLAEAAAVYAGVEGVRIPALHRGCTPTMTAMERIRGLRITDAEMKWHKTLARLTFEAIICFPLFSSEDAALFHGAPHAGNILAVDHGYPAGIEVGLIDWTLAGRLSRRERVQIMEMLVGIVTEDISRISSALRLMTVDGQNGTGAISIEGRVKSFLASIDIHGADPLKTAFMLIEEMTLAGLVFPSQLILFRKAFFTLEGVLQDVWPGFSMGEAMENYLERLLIAELPMRIYSSFMPFPVDTSRFPSLLSHEALAKLSLYRMLSPWRRSAMMGSSWLEAQARMSADFIFYIWRGGSAFGMRKR